jgi:diaminopimelate decarboxylase
MNKTGEKNVPFTRGDLARIIEKYPTPFHLYDERRIRKNARDLFDAFAWNASYREFFAVKANPNPVILGILGEEGCGVDCSSYTELLLSKRAGFSGDEIMFSSNVTPEADMKLASKIGARVNLDDITHIPFLERCGGIPETVSLRYNPGDGFTIGNTIMSRPSQSKYGFTRAQLSEGLRILSSLGAKRFGIHSFLSSNTTDEAYYPALAEMLFTTVAELSDETGLFFDSVNLSGGIGIPYRPGETAVDIRAVGEKIRKLHESILSPAGLGHVAIHSELGRWMLGPAGYLVSTVIHEKRIYRNYLGLDACAANLMRPAMYGAYHHITVSGKENEPCEETWDVVGGLCENNDKFGVDRLLPRVGIGDVVVMHDTGAHGFSMGYNYNGKLRSAEILLRENGNAELIRRAETPEDYFATLDV